jgi:hypothetical protein
MGGGVDVSSGWLTDVDVVAGGDTSLVRLTIEIIDDHGAVSGWLEPEGRPRRSFIGMLELMAMLDALRQVRSATVEADGRINLDG